MAVPFKNIFLKVDTEVGIIDLPTYAADIVANSIMYIIPCVLWLTAFVRLKEKEI